MLDQNKSKISRGRAGKYKFKKKNIEPIFGKVNVEKNKPGIIKKNSQVQGLNSEPEDF